MDQDQRVVVHIDDKSVRGDGLRDLVRVLRRRQTGADVQELADPALTGQETHGPAEELPVRPR